MCDCIKNTVNKFKEMYPEAENISYQNIEMLSQRVYSTVEIKLPDKKKPIERLVLHSYCPICGKKYDDN